MCDCAAITAFCWADSSLGGYESRTSLGKDGLVALTEQNLVLIVQVAWARVAELKALVGTPLQATHSSPPPPSDEMLVSERM